MIRRMSRVTGLSPTGQDLHKRLRSGPASLDEWGRRPGHRARLPYLGPFTRLPGHPTLSSTAG